MRKLLSLMACALVMPTLAQAQVPVDAATPDPVRIAAASKLIDTTLPPNRRDAMITGMMQAMTANMTASLQSNPQVASMFTDDPRVQPIFARFITRMQNESAGRLKVALPGMIAAMQRAYARRFTAPQMAEMTAFFATPTGRLYMEQGQSIMSDPDVAAWQRQTMGETFAQMPTQIQALVAELRALKPPGKLK